MQLHESELWWKGPSLLRKELSPTKAEIAISKIELPERRTISKFSFLSQGKPEDLIERFSSYQRMLRVMTYVLRFTNRTRKRTTPSTTWITTEELHNSRIILIKTVQKVHFDSDIKALQRNTSLRQYSRLRSLTPFLDKDGLIRVGGRLSNNDLLSFTEKHPYIIPKESQLDY